MEIKDDFIVGIFNYCDRWCERCPLTNRCRVFASEAELEFERDHGPIGEPFRERQAKKIAENMERWEKTFGINFDEIMSEVDRARAAGEELDTGEVRLEDLELDTRAMDYACALINWRRTEPAFETAEARDAAEVITFYSTLVPAKINRALLGLTDGEDDDVQSDGNGSAKIALLGLARSRVAWTQLVAGGAVTHEFAQNSLREIDFFIQQLDAKFPNARAFVRPGFDEPDEVKNLENQNL